MGNETQSQFQQRVVDEYFDSLVKLVEARLGKPNLRLVDGEDIALSALGSFLSRYGSESRRQLGNADSLWPLIATIARRKALNHIRREGQLKRGGGEVRGESVFSEGNGIVTEPDQSPRPDAIVESSETVRLLLSRLNPELAAIARCKLEGFTNREIAANLGCSIATVERRLKMIRSAWQSTIE